VAYNLVFPDLNFASDIFLHDHLTGETTRVSVGALGAEGNGGSILPSLSDDGRYVAFVSSANNLGEGDTNGRADVFRYDRTTGSVRCISEDAFGHSANGASTMPAMSSDGSLLVFASRASDLVMGDTNQLRDVFVYVVP
jgi:Tol biopolymer transport system component